MRSERLACLVKSMAVCTWAAAMLLGVLSMAFAPSQWSLLLRAEMALAVTAALVSAVTPILIGAYRAHAIRQLQRQAHVSQQDCIATARWFWIITASLMGSAAVLNISVLAAAAWFIGHIALAPAILVRSWMPGLFLGGVAVWLVADARLLRLARHT